MFICRGEKQEKLKEKKYLGYVEYFKIILENKQMSYPDQAEVRKDEWQMLRGQSLKVLR